MKVVHVCRHVPPYPCGVSDYAWNLSRALASLGTEVVVLCSDTVVSSCERTASFRIVPLGPALTSACFSSVRDVLYREKPDVVLLQYSTYHYGRWNIGMSLLAALCRLKLNCPVVVVLHEFYSPVELKAGDVLGAWWDRLKDTLVILTAHRLVVTLESRHLRLERLCPHKRGLISVIPVGANIEPCSVEADQAGLWRDRLDPSNEFLLLNVGLPHRDKQYEVILRALRLLVDDGLPVKLLLLGRPQGVDRYVQEIEAMVETLGLMNRVVWSGYQSPEEVRGSLAISDLFVSADLRGISGRKSSLMLPLAHGVPVVASKGEETEPLWERSSAIRLFDVGDSRVCASAVKELLLNLPERQRLAAAGQALYSRHFSWSAIGSRMREVLHDAVQASAGV